MQYFSTLVLLALAPSTLAQYYGPGPDSGPGPFSMDSAASATSASAAAASTGLISVEVGRGGLVFSPSSVSAAVGAQVVFNFYPRNHSVVQSSFSSPCIPSQGGIYSGFQPVTGPNAQTFTITINDTKPVWIYCSQGEHCQSGMVMVINEPTNSPNTLAAYKLAAAGTTSSSPAAIAGGVTSGSSTSASSNSASSSIVSSSIVSSSSASSTSGSNTSGSNTSGSSTSGSSISGSSTSTSPSSTSSSPATTSSGAASSTEFGYGGLGVVISAFAFAFGLLA